MNGINVSVELQGPTTTLASKDANYARALWILLISENSYFQLHFPEDIGKEIYSSSFIPGRTRNTDQVKSQTTDTIGIYAFGDNPTNPFHCSLCLMKFVASA